MSVPLVQCSAPRAVQCSAVQVTATGSTGRRGASKMRGRGRYKHLNEGERLPRSMKTAPGMGRKKVTIGR